jgi:hypothetical protein
MEDKEKMLERVQALIAKAESTEHEEEAKIFFAKAQELLTKYSLSEYDLKNLGAKTNDTVVTIAFLVSEPCTTAKLQLLSTVSKANNLKIVVSGFKKRASKTTVPTDGRLKQPLRFASSDNKSVNYRTAYLSGFTRDIDAVTLLYTSMLIQSYTAIARETIPTYVNKGTWTSHFLQGFSDAIRPRLMAAKRTTEKTVVEEAKASGSDMLPVLASRTQQVQAEYERVWNGNLRNGRQSYNRSNTGGYGAGRSAGSTADIGNRRIGGVGALGTGK